MDYVTKSGHVLTEADIEKLAAEAEAGYDPAQVTNIRLGRERQISEQAFIWAVLAAFDGSYDEGLGRDLMSSATGNVVTVNLYREGQDDPTDSFELTVRRLR